MISVKMFVARLVYCFQSLSLFSLFSLFLCCFFFRICCFRLFLDQTLLIEIPIYDEEGTVIICNDVMMVMLRSCYVYQQNILIPSVH